MGPWADELSLLRRAGVKDLLVRLVLAPEERWHLARQAADAGLFPWVRLEETADVARARQHPSGLHLPARWRPSDLELGGLPWTAACHDDAALARAARATAVLVSPIYRPGSKPDDARTPLGTNGLAAKARSTAAPVLALGGLHSGRVAEVIAAGAWGVAGIGAFFSAGRVRLAGAVSLVTAVAEATEVGGLRPPSTSEGS